jgi:hypothetical protein
MSKPVVRGVVSSVVRSVVASDFSWSSYWTTLWNSLTSAVVEDAEPTKVVLTFSKADTKVVASDFTIAGKTITLLERDATNKILTLTVSLPFIYGDTPVVTFVKTGGTANVINNVLYTMLLTSTGTGAGVSTLKMTVSSDITVTLGANAKFYSDAAGTLNESATWTITSGALRTIYLKCTAGTALMTFSDISKITEWGNSITDGWTSTTNASKITSIIGKMPLTKLRITGTSELTGALPTGLTYLYLSGTSISWTYSGALPTGLTYLYLSGNSISWTYSGALPTGLTTLLLSGNSISWTYSGALPTGLTYLYLSGTSISWTYSGALPTGLTYLYLSGTSISWTYSGALPTGLITLYLSGTSIAWTYSGALPTGLITLYLSGTSIAWTGLDVGNNGNIGTFSLLNYRDTKMSSSDMVTLLTQMTNRTGTLPATVTINDYADYASPPSEVTDAVTTLKSTKSITTVNLGA